MSDEQQQPGAREAQIPDGGLGSAMPAWLQQPPAWKREPVEVPAPARPVPPPDESVIDPGTMLDSDDLPRWLQDLARPADPPETKPAGATIDGRPEQVEPADAADQPAPVQPGGGPPLEPVIPEAMADVESIPAIEPASFSRRNGVDGAGRTAAWWLSDRVLGLVLLGIVLAMIYIVLAVSGVV